MKERSIKLKDLLKEAMPFASFKTDKLTSKMWILPNGEVKSLNQWHSDWLQSNSEIASKFGLDLTDVPKNEQAIRMAALKVGFIRVNYEINNGTLTIEANSKFFTKKIRDILFALVADNVSSVDNITINLFNDNGKVVRSESNVLFRYDDQEKLNNLPMLSENKKDVDSDSSESILE